MTIMERVATALEIKKIGRKNLTVSFLGEGAWHEAYLFSTNELESTVIRFPKAFSYQNSLRLIDPLPIIYSGHVFAGNILNNFHTLFPTYHRSPRYKQHDFHLVKNQLDWFADGFIDGYAQAEMDVRYSVFAEEFLLLLDLAHHHVKVLEEDFTEEVVLRVGNRHAVAERLPIYLRKLETFDN